MLKKTTLLHVNLAVSGLGAVHSDGTVLVFQTSRKKNIHISCLHETMLLSADNGCCVTHTVVSRQAHAYNPRILNPHLQFHSTKRGQGRTMEYTCNVHSREQTCMHLKEAAALHATATVSTGEHSFSSVSLHSRIFAVSLPAMCSALSLLSSQHKASTAHACCCGGSASMHWCSVAPDARRTDTARWSGSSLRTCRATPCIGVFPCSSGCIP